MLLNQGSRKPRSNLYRKNVHEQTLFRNRRAQPSNHNLLSGLRLASSFGLDGPGNPHHLSRGSRWPYPSTVQGRKRGLSRRGKRRTRLVQKSGWGFPRDQGAQAGDQGLRSAGTKPRSLRELGTKHPDSLSRKGMIHRLNPLICRAGTPRNSQLRSIPQEPSDRYLRGQCPY